MGAIWSGASELLLTILEFFYGLTNSFGLAIVLLTIAVRIVLYPLNQKQMTSMQQMQKIQPRLKVLQEKYATQHAVGVVAWFEFDAKVTDSQKMAVLTMKSA